MVAAENVCINQFSNFGYSIDPEWQKMPIVSLVLIYISKIINLTTHTCLYLVLS